MSSHPTSIWRRSPNKLRQNEIWLECFYFTSLFVAALVLFLINLGHLPLLDFDEGIVGQVAKEIFQNFQTPANWIFPTLWGEPYLAQPPLVHGLIAITYGLFGVSEFTTRFPGALLGAVSVILVYNIGREIFVARFPALFSALVYLTCLPVVRYSRLAMSDGPLLCFELLAIWAILRSRRDLRWSVVAGLGLGLMSLTKGVVSLQILAMLVIFLLWDTPRLLTSSYFLGGLILGAMPGISWYLAQWFHYQDLKTTADFLNLFLGKVNYTGFATKLSVEYVLLQTIQYVLPWLMMILAGLKLATHHIHWGWGKLLVAWIAVYLPLVCLVFNREYCSILPLYPGLALAAGRQLDLIRNLPSYIKYPQVWTYSFVLMATMAAFAGLHWGISNYIDFYLPFICGSLAITFAACAITISQREQQFILLLFWGLFVSLFLLVISPHWIWELNTVEPAKPIAELIRQHTAEGEVIYTSMSQKRNSLDFYSDRQIVNQKITDLQRHWQQDSHVSLLVDSQAIKQLKIPTQTIVQDPKFASLNWMLAIKGS